MKAESFSITAIISNNSAMGVEGSGVGRWGDWVWESLNKETFVSV